MAFKMRSGNKTSFKKMGSAFAKSSPMKVDPPASKDAQEDIKIKRGDRPSKKEISLAMEQAVPGTEDMHGIPDYEEKYTAEDRASGAGASKDFLGTEHGGYRTKVKVTKGSKPRKSKVTDREFNVTGSKKNPNRTVVGLETEAGKEKSKKKAKTNIFTGSKTMKIDPIDQKEQRVRVEEHKQKDPETGEKPYLGSGTAKSDVEWGFEGGTKQDKDISDRKRKATLKTKGKDAGTIEEKYKSKLGIYRKTVRKIEDPAYKEAAEKKKAEAPSEKAKNKQKKKDQKAKNKQERKDKRARIEAQHAEADRLDQERRSKNVADRKAKKNKGPKAPSYDAGDGPRY